MEGESNFNEDSMAFEWQFNILENNVLSPYLKYSGSIKYVDHLMPFRKAVLAQANLMLYQHYRTEQSLDLKID